MKVVSGPAEWAKKVKCGSCKAVLIAELADVRVGFFGANHGGETAEEKVYVVCSVCGTDLKIEHAPPLVLKRARENTARGKKVVPRA